MVLKSLILGVSVVLMAVVALLSVAGIRWGLEAQWPPLSGGPVVLAVSGLAALICLWRLWATRHDHLR